MESQSFNDIALTKHTINQMIEACELIILWNKDVRSTDDYLLSPEGMQKMAASCMLIESIGEGVKKIDRIMPGFLVEIAPETPWKNIKGLRDHIAHGYFNIDADIVFDVSINEIVPLKKELSRILIQLSSV